MQRTKLELDKEREENEKLKEENSLLQSKITIKTSDLFAKESHIAELLSEIKGLEEKEKLLNIVMSQKSEVKNYKNSIRIH